MGGLERKIFDCCESHAPIKTKRVRSGNVPWITSDLREGMRDRDVAIGKLLSLTILTTGLRNLLRHPIMLMHLSGLMVTHVKPGK